MKNLLFKTDRSTSPVLVRLFLAAVIFPHGAQKLLGWFNGYGFEGTMNYFTVTEGLPWLVGFVVIIVEFFGPLALLFGFAVRFWSLANAVVMTGIIITNFNQHFFMNWDGTQKTEGFEFFLLTIGMSVALVISGAGKYSIDAWLYHKAPVKRKDKIAPAYLY